jgi:hypothetical protein
MPGAYSQLEACSRHLCGGVFAGRSVRFVCHAFDLQYFDGFDLREAALD